MSWEELFVTGSDGMHEGAVRATLHERSPVNIRENEHRENGKKKRLATIPADKQTGEKPYGSSIQKIPI